MLFLDCLLQMVAPDPNDPEGWMSPLLGELNSETGRTIFVIAATLTLTYTTYRGLDVVGDVAVIISVFSLTPFIVFCAVGMFYVKPFRWAIAPSRGLRAVNWRLFLNTFFWNINYWDSAATFSGEVDNPGETFPKGIIIAVLLVFATTFLPILIGTGAVGSTDGGHNTNGEPYSEWTDGYFVHLGARIGGQWLGAWLLLASAVTNMGMFIAEMSSDAWMVAGMADRGIIPKVFGMRHSQYDTPIVGIALSAVCTVTLASISSFSEIVEMLNMVFCCAQAIEFCAFVSLRIYKPELPRPYRVPVDTVGCCVILLLPFLFIVVIISFSSASCLLFTGVVVMLGVINYYVLQHAKRNSWCVFENCVDDDASGSLSLLIPQIDIQMESIVPNISKSMSQSETEEADLLLSKRSASRSRSPLASYGSTSSDAVAASADADGAVSDISLVGPGSGGTSTDEQTVEVSTNSNSYKRYFQSKPLPPTPEVVPLKPSPTSLITPPHATAVTKSTVVGQSYSKYKRTPPSAPPSEEPATTGHTPGNTGHNVGSNAAGHNAGSTGHTAGSAGHNVASRNHHSAAPSTNVTPPVSSRMRYGKSST